MFLFTFQISCSAPVQPQPPRPTMPLLPTTLPSGVSIVPLKKIQPKPEPRPHQPVKWGDHITFDYPQIKHEEYQANGHKRMKLLSPFSSANSSMIITPKPSNKPMPNLNPIKPKALEENDELDVTQFLSISLEKPQDDTESLRQKCQLLEKQVQKREHTIRQMNLQLRSLRKKMDSISIQKILQDNFKGLTYDILNCYINNTNLDAYEKRYDDSVKRFAMKLFDCSEEAYGIVRENFDLPHPGNVSHWLRASEDQDLDEVGLDLSPHSSEHYSGKNSSGEFSGHEEGQYFGQDSKDSMKQNGNEDPDSGVPKIESYSSIAEVNQQNGSEDSGSILPKIEKYSLDELNITMEPVDSCE